MLTDENRKKLFYPYRCLMRPPTPGAIPIDGLLYVDGKERKTLDGRHIWGIAVYTRKLSPEEVERFELEETCFCTVDNGERLT